AKANTSFNVSLEPARPFWVLEYVSRSNPRKDYVDNLEKYERQLKVPYHLRFDAERQDLTLYHHTGKKYVTLKRNARDRYPIPELELEVGLRDSWVRFWHRGELLPLPADLQRDLEQARRHAAEADRRAESEARRADELQRRLEQSQRELAQLQAQSLPPRPRRNQGPPPVEPGR
ncbi:MAG TPA: Uma2 family endonuclease, partial [Pirellulales bacterium]|nr:Uma2 family endonuclease [Pirellulales bacterium]